MSKLNKSKIKEKQENETINISIVLICFSFSHKRKSIVKPWTRTSCSASCRLLVVGKCRLHDSWWWGCDRLFFQARLYSLPSLNHRRGVVVAQVLGVDGIEFSVPATQLWARCLRSSSCTGYCCNYEAPNDSICV